MAASSFCETNFNCSLNVIEPDICYDYVKQEADINCYYPCLIENCTKIPNSETSCIEYDCIGLLSPIAPSSISNPLTIVLIAFCALFFFTILALVLYIVYKIKRRQFRQLPTEEQQSLLERNSQENEGQNDDGQHEPTAPSNEEASGGD